MRDKILHRERERHRYHAIKTWTGRYGPIPHDENGRAYHIHHKDRDWSNNELSNLECVSRKDHEAIHLEERREAVRANDAMQTARIGNKFGKANKGKIRSAETRKLISIARTGVPMSDATKQKIAASSIGLNKGRKKSADEIERREASKRAKRLLSPEYGQPSKETPEL